MSEIKLETELFFQGFFGKHWRSTGDGKKICEFAEAYHNTIQANEVDTSHDKALDIDLVSDRIQDYECQMKFYDIFSEEYSELSYKVRDLSKALEILREDSDL